MRYKKEILIAGATAIRRQRVENLEAEQRENYEEEERLLQQYNDDQPQIEKIAREILRKAENGEELSSEYVAEAFKIKTSPNGHYSRTLGLDKHTLAKVTRRIKEVERKMVALEEEPLALVEFLNAIEDDLVSDYGIKAAGFSVKTAELLTQGLKEIRREKDPERQAAEESA